MGSFITKVRRLVSGRSVVHTPLSAAAMASLRISEDIDFDAVDSPASLLEFLRRSFEPLRLEVQEDSRARRVETEPHARFSALVDVLKRGVPELSSVVASTIAQAADEAMASQIPFVRGTWAADIGLHSRLASSGPKKGRILTAAVRILRPSVCVEIGTAYGLSALFIGHALRECGTGGHVHTLEVAEPQASFARTRLEDALPDSCTPHSGSADDLLPRVLAGLSASVDLVFHDGGHRGENYVRDFEVLLPHMTDGGVILFDDIRWEDQRFGSGPAHTYEGWQQVAGHDAVVASIEIDGSIGVVQVSTG